ncbi:MAG: RecX family transcriptional regulator [Gemmatimonadota bacterium]
MKAALRYLAYRPRSTVEVRRRLRRDRFSSSNIEQVLGRCSELGYLSDQKFAEAWIRDRIRLKPCGTMRLRSELMRRGVRTDDIDAAIAEVFEQEQVSDATLLEKVAERRWARLQLSNPTKAPAKLFAYLTRRGFAVRAAREAVRRLSASEDDHA